MGIAKRSGLTDGLNPADLALCVFGPWHANANVEGDKKYWHARCDTPRLRALLETHGDVIRGEAKRAGLATSWAAQRLFFVDAIGAPREP
ncbi:MAG: hypothetical protein H0X67_08170 [Acidobacteria bacterium]|nr:hypothetical protein [Acidobacteriota bacterium]